MESGWLLSKAICFGYSTLMLSCVNENGKHPKFGTSQILEQFWYRHFRRYIYIYDFVSESGAYILFQVRCRLNFVPYFPISRKGKTGEKYT